MSSVLADDDPGNSARVRHAVETVLGSTAQEVSVCMVADDGPARIAELVECLEGDRVDPVGPPHHADCIGQRAQDSGVEGVRDRAARPVIMSGLTILDRVDQARARQNRSLPAMHKSASRSGHAGNIEQAVFEIFEMEIAEAGERREGAVRGAEIGGRTEQSGLARSHHSQADAKAGRIARMKGGT